MATAQLGPVLVTGGSGYIAGFLIRRLLEQGWTVHTTVRSLDREAAVRRLLEVDDAQLRFFAADLLSDDGWAQAVAGCTHVAHLASPLPAGVPRDAMVLIRPARDGALRVLKAAHAAAVRRFVMTSSVAAIAYGHGKGRGEFRYTEADWTPLERPDITPYVQSKTAAERAARDWVAQHGAGLSFCTINPSLVLGPVWSSDHSASVAVVQRMLMGKLSRLPDFGFGVVDVRDVAELHLRALTATGLDGERFIASGRFMKLAEVAQVLKRELGDEASRVSTRTLPDAVVRIAAWFSPVARAVVDDLGAVRVMDASHARQVLGWATRPEEQSIVDTARSLIALGLVRA